VELTDFFYSANKEKKLSENGSKIFAFLKYVLNKFHILPIFLPIFNTSGGSTYVLYILACIKFVVEEVGSRPR
jgi:hypothetical protein